MPKMREAVYGQEHVAFLRKILIDDLFAGCEPHVFQLFRNFRDSCASAGRFT